MKARSAVAGALVAGTVMLGATAAKAADTLIKVPAPVGVAQGAGLNVDGIVTVGQTGAAAGQDSAVAGAVPVAVLGKPLIGGTQSGTGQKSGALLDTGATPLGRLEVAPFKVSASQTATQRQASAESAAARADVIDPDFIHVDVLQSASSATHVGQLSRGQAVSDGVVVRIGGPDGTVIRILHSDADATGHGRSYLLAIGNNAVLDDAVLDAVCSLDLGPLLELACVQVAGGAGGLTAEVLSAVVGGANGLTASAISATGSGGVGTALGSRVLADTDTRATAAATGLARTGHQLWLMMMLGVALVALGLVIMAMANTRVLVPVRVNR